MELTVTVKALWPITIDQTFYWDCFTIDSAFSIYRFVSTTQNPMLLHSSTTPVHFPSLPASHDKDIALISSHHNAFLCHRG